MIDHYILVGQTPVPVAADARTPEGFAGLLEWARWFETADRHVMRTRILDDLCEVSTVFLGLDHGFGEGRPLLFETMAFWWPARYDSHQQRCSTWLEAEAQHQRIVAHVSQPHVILAFLCLSLQHSWRSLCYELERSRKKLLGLPLDEYEQIMDRVRSR